MFEVTFFYVDGMTKIKTCDVGDLLPTIATMLQEYERSHGKYEYQRNYAVQWRRVRE